MQLAIVAALGENNVIGKNNQLPWHMPADLKFFKQTTLGKPVIMGRKTFESIGKPLPGRQNIIVTRQTNFHVEGCQVVNSLEQAIQAVQNVEEACIIGGAEIFREALPKVNRLYLTFIHHDFKGDAFFPDWHPENWQTIQRVDCEPDEKNPYAYSFVTLERKQGALNR